METRFLVCATDHDWVTHACLPMSSDLAGQLLDYRWIVDKAVEFDRNLYCLEFHDWAVTFGGKLLRLPDHDIEFGCWYLAQEDPQPDPYWRTTCQTLRVLKDGVMWSAHPKHSDRPDNIETETISWAQLEAVKAGRWPFPDAKGGQ